MEEVLKYPGCFVCGDDNRCGLKAKFYSDGNQVVTELTAQRDFEGYQDIYHGGIIATVLDEVMVKAILADQRYAVTAEMTVRFFKPVPVGEKLRFVGKIVKTRGRMFITESEATGEDGTVFARATGKYIEARGPLKQSLVKSTEQ